MQYPSISSAVAAGIGVGISLAVLAVVVLLRHRKRLRNQQTIEAAKTMISTIFTSMNATTMAASLGRPIVTALSLMNLTRFVY